MPVNAIVTSGIGSPEQIVPPPLTTAVGREFVVIVAEPTKEVPVQLASDKAVTVYVPSKAPAITYGEAAIPATLTGVTPSVYVKFQGALPVKAIVMLGIGSPIQIIPPPEITAVGNGSVTIVAEPLVVPVHKASFTAVTV